MKKRPEVVLVPPLLERDHRGRSRLTKSSYDFQFCKPQLKWLFLDYIKPGATGLLRFSPVEDPRVSVKARLAIPDQGVPSQASTAGAICLRFQPDPNEYFSFVDLKAAQAGAAQLRGCYFDPDAGVGVFARLPVTGDQQGSQQSVVGFRYGSGNLSAGFICQPLVERLTHLWLVGQQGPFTAGWQLRPRSPLTGFLQNAQTSFVQQLAAAHSHSSYALAYAPVPAQSGRGTFTTVVELREQRELVISFLHHMAVQRPCRNPFEEREVVGIANYLDLGLQLITRLNSTGTSGSDSNISPSSAPDLCFAAALQVNKNVQLKVRASTQSIAAAAAFKAWWQPSWLAAASATWDFVTQQPRLGLTVHVENYGNIRYERSQERGRTGKALMQRHVALPEEIANSKGQGLLVDKEHINDPATLGQRQRRSDGLL